MSSVKVVRTLSCNELGVDVDAIELVDRVAGCVAQRMCKYCAIPQQPVLHRGNHWHRGLAGEPIQCSADALHKTNIAEFSQIAEQVLADMGLEPVPEQVGDRPTPLWDMELPQGGDGKGGGGGGEAR